MAANNPPIDWTQQKYFPDTDETRGEYKLSVADNGVLYVGDFGQPKIGDVMLCHTVYHPFEQKATENHWRRWNGSEWVLIPQLSDADAMIAKLRELTPQQRLEIFSAFCRECGGENPHCHCWNNE